MEWLVKRAIQRYLKKHYPKHRKQIIAGAKRIQPKLMAKAPDLGGRENSLADNLNMFILFCPIMKRQITEWQGKRLMRSLMICIVI